MDFVFGLHYGITAETVVRTKVNILSDTAFVLLWRVNSHLDKKEQEEDERRKTGRGQRKKDADDFDSNEDYDDDDIDDLKDEDGGDFDSNSEPNKTQTKTCALPDVSRVDIKD